MPDEQQQLRETLAFWIEETNKRGHIADHAFAAAAHLAQAVTAAVKRAEAAEQRAKDLERQLAEMAEKDAADRGL